MRKIKHLITYSLLFAMLSMTITGCSTTVTNTNSSIDDKVTIDSNDIQTTEASIDETIENNTAYQFVKNTFDHYHSLGYSNNFISALASMMYSESGGNAATVEYGYIFEDAFNEFMDTSRNVNDKDKLLDAYHKYGNDIYNDTDKPAIESLFYTNDNDDVCVGLGLMLWTGITGDNLLLFAPDGEPLKWYDPELQYLYLDSQLVSLDIIPGNYNDGSAEDILTKLLADYLLINANETTLISKYTEHLSEIENIVEYIATHN